MQYAIWLVSNPVPAIITGIGIAPLQRCSLARGSAGKRARGQSPGLLFLLEVMPSSTNIQHRILCTVTVVLSMRVYKNSYC